MGYLNLFYTILLLSILLPPNSDGKRPQSMPPSKVSKIGRPTGNRSPFGLHRGSGCTVPPAPMNGRVRCILSLNKQTCTGECYDGYQFPDKNVNVLITCGRDGILRPAANFPDCRPVCDSPCENGGTCVGPNICRCRKNFWGKLCETPVSVCNLRATHHVGYKCRIRENVMTCSLECGQGLRFEFPPASFYSCTPVGIWSPSRIPNCVPDGNFQRKYETTDRRTGIPGGEIRCQPPLAPVHGLVSCRRSSPKHLLCVGRCAGGHQFPDQALTKRITCDQATGVLMPTTKFPDCERKFND